MNVARQYLEKIMQGQILKQQTKTQEVDGVLVYTTMPYAVLVEFTQNFFNIMGHYMHSIVEKTWPDKLREELFKKFIGDYNPKVDTLNRIRDF